MNAMRSTSLLLATAAALVSGIAVAQTAPPGAPSPAPAHAPAPATAANPAGALSADMARRAGEYINQNNNLMRIFESQAALFKAKAEAEKAARDLRAAESGTASTAGSSAAGVPVGGQATGQAAGETAAPGADEAKAGGAQDISVRWIAGPADGLEAYLDVANYGGVVVRNGSEIPGTGLTVESVSAIGVTAVATSGVRRTLPFSR